jgi:hypothetical protein
LVGLLIHGVQILISVEERHKSNRIGCPCNAHIFALRWARDKTSRKGGAPGL